jgi:ASCH domain.
VSERVKALSLWQPHASLVALGLKQYETRGWYTAYRGKLIIHAAKKWSYQQQQLARRFVQLFPACHALVTHPLLDALVWHREGVYPVFGAALCVCDLVECIPAERLVPAGTRLEADDRVGQISFQEYCFGDFSPGRFALKLANVQLFTKPVPVPGRQSLWDWTQEVPA